MHTGLVTLEIHTAGIYGALHAATLTEQVDVNATAHANGEILQLTENRLPA